MSIFDNHILSPLDPQTMFEKLCEDTYGFNLTVGNIYTDGFNSNYLWEILRKVRLAHPDKKIIIKRTGKGNLVVEVNPIIYFNDQIVNVE